ncbi:MULTISPECIES: hypothetical protein [unclassified Kitasatospora]
MDRVPEVTLVGDADHLAAPDGYGADPAVIELTTGQGGLSWTRFRRR